MYKKVIVVGTALALAASLAVPAFAETNGDTMASSTPKEMKMEMRTASSTPKVKVDPAVKIACVGAAVNTREAALVTAMTAFTTATNGDYAARAAALAAAYASATSTRAIGAATKTAWETFTASEKSARKAWQAARDAAWKSYRTAAVACGAPAGTGDGVNSASEKTGN